jgi:hypothetical protein
MVFAFAALGCLLFLLTGGFILLCHKLGEE